jgi:MYXO-CTERM domain-containing protein
MKTPLLLATLVATSSLPAANVTLNSTWSEFDWNQTNPTTPNAGILQLSGQSSTGFTAAIGENTLDVDGSAGIDSSGRPRIFQTFTPLALSTVGDSVSLSFTATAANAMVAGDSQFRWALGQTGKNHGIWASTDFGTPGGNTATTRFDGSITDPAVSTAYSAGNFGHFLNSGTTRGSSSTVVNGTAIGDPLVNLAIEHYYTLNIARVAGGLAWDFSYGNNNGAGGPNTVSVGFFDDSITQTDGANGVMNTVDSLAFMLWNNAPFGAATTGSFTVSNILLTGNPVPEPAALGLLGLGALLGLRRRR